MRKETWKIFATDHLLSNRGEAEKVIVRGMGENTNGYLACTGTGLWYYRTFWKIKWSRQSTKTSIWCWLKTVGSVSWAGDARLGCINSTKEEGDNSRMRVKCLDEIHY